MIDEVKRGLDAAVLAGDPPAAVCCVFVDGAVVHESAHGTAPDGREVSGESLFDLASVTKAVATTTAVATLIARGALSLDDTIERFFPDVRGARGATVRALLTHRSGLPAWRPYFLDLLQAPLDDGPFSASPPPDAGRRGWDRVMGSVLAEELETPGRRVYSDLGYMLLGAIVERVAGGQRLDHFCRDAIHAPLGLDRELGFWDLDEGAPMRGTPSWIGDRLVLPTGRSRPREPAPGQEHLRTESWRPTSHAIDGVDDDNAFAMGGVAGHAGLFGTARAVAGFGAKMLDELDAGGPLGLGGVLPSFFSLEPDVEDPRGLGWDVPTGPRSSAGSLGGGPRGAFGHLGFTGCSLWIDLDRRLSAALLTNRTLPGRDRVDGIRALRPAVHDALADAVALPPTC